MIRFSFMKGKKTESKNFFDLRSSEKTKIIRKAAIESTKEQVKTLKKYGYLFTR